jgi:hypothetical protein
MPYPVFSETPETNLRNNPNLRSNVKAGAPDLILGLQKRLSLTLEDAADEMMNIIRSAGVGVHDDSSTTESAISIS